MSEGIFGRQPLIRINHKTLIDKIDEMPYYYAITSLSLTYTSYPGSFQHSS